MNLDNIPHYFYNNEKYGSRKKVLEKMLLKEDYEGEFSFKFCEEIFGSINWSQDLEVNLATLYLERAKQIREEYDYIVLSYSGGSDSNQILSTFLKNGIFIDEILNINYDSMGKSISDYENYPDDLKQLLEYNYSVLPKLKEVSKISSKTKITSIDSTDFIVSEFVNKKTYKPLTILDGKEYVHYRAYNVRPTLFCYHVDRYMKNNSFKSKKTCLLRGFEKPILTIDEKLTVKCFFSDIMMAGSNYFRDDDFEIENFFWSHKAPLIPIKQSQVLKKVLETDKTFFVNFYQAKKAIRNHDDSISHIQAHMIEREFSKYIYPDWNPNVYAASKTIVAPGEIIAMNALNLKNFVLEVTKDIRETEQNKYSKIKNKKLLAQTLYTKSYILGKLIPNWS